MAKTKTGKTIFLGCRLTPDTAKRFREIAKEKKRPPAQLLRVMAEELVEASAK